MLKSLSQLHSQLVIKKSSISKLFEQQISVPNLSQQLDYQSQNITFSKIFSLIPSQQKLKQMQQNIQIQQKQYKLQNYKGEYQIVHKVKQKMQYLKNDAKDMYYLFTEINLPKIKECYKKEKQQGKIKLKSYQLIYGYNNSTNNNNNNNNNNIKSNNIKSNNKYMIKQQQLYDQQDKIYKNRLNSKKKQTQKYTNLNNINNINNNNNNNNNTNNPPPLIIPKSTKANKFQRNTISQDYLYQIKQNSLKQQLQPQSCYLKNDDLLITVCVYDSLNKQKQHEFIILGDMKLSELKKQIYCVVQKIREQQKQQHINNINHNNNHNHINNNHNNNHYPHNSLKKQPRQQSCFFLIQQNIYYYGSHNCQQQIDNLLKSIQSSYQIQLHKFSMTTIDIKSLRVVFGRPYLFRHMNGCDHMIVFKDIKLFNKQNGIQPDNKKKYPLMIFQSKMKKRKCQGCQNKFAKLACQGDKLKNGQTTYLCKECHENIHNQFTNPQNKLMVVVPYRHQ